MKKAMKTNARYFLAAILSIMLLTALVGFAAVAANAAASTDKQTTDYGTVDWSNAAHGYYITFTASESEEVFVLQGPNGTQTSFAVDEGETVNIALTDGTGTYQYAICHNTGSGGSACLVNYKGNFVVGETDTALAS